MSDPIRTRKRGGKGKGEKRKVEWERGERRRERKETEEKSEKGERGDVVVPPHPL